MKVELTFIKEVAYRVELPALRKDINKISKTEHFSDDIDTINSTYYIIEKEVSK